MHQLLIGVFFLGICSATVFANAMPFEDSQEISKESKDILKIDAFIELAIHNDTEFEEILINELALQYQKDLRLPARDLVLSVREDYNVYLTQSRREPDTTVSLSKLFPYVGTSIEASYEVTPSISSSNVSSELSVTISQPIAENAFGKATRLLDKIVGIETDVARHQIIEAYEDYFAMIVVAYYDWYESYENLKIAEASYALNLKLLDNIKERQSSSIALPIDVNKVTLQVMAKEEKLVELRQVYEDTVNFILKSTRMESGNIIPQEPSLFREESISFDRDFQNFKDEGRTYKVLNLLEQKSIFEVDKNANELLPSINLLIGYSQRGSKYRIVNEDNLLFAGVSVEWPFFEQVERAEYEVSKIMHDKTKLSTVNTHYRLYTNIRNLTQLIEREKRLAEIAETKIQLAQDILNDEMENYSFGKVSLNDYIDAVNVLDNNRFNKIDHDMQYKRLYVEWLRITDRIIQSKQGGYAGKHPNLNQL